MVKKLIFFLTFIILGFSISFTQEQILYKQIDTTKLYLEIYHPQNINQSDNHPAIIFFFGGGWIGGNRHHFLNHAKYFSERGMVCFLVDYRTKNKHGTTPFECLKDAKSAIRFIRQNALAFNIDPSKIIAAGGSAGGHLASATALIHNYNDPADDLSISCIPNALALFNPVFDNGPGGYGYERIGNSYKDFSPLHNIQQGAPPTIIFLGTQDKLVPVETAEYYKKVMETVQAKCELKLYKGQGHGFFNYDHKKYYRQTVRATDQFLQSLGYLKNTPIIKPD